MNEARSEGPHREPDGGKLQVRFCEGGTVSHQRARVPLLTLLATPATDHLALLAAR